MVFQEATSEPTEIAKKPTAWHLMPHNQHPGKQGCIVSSVITKIFYPPKYWTVTIQPFCFYVQWISVYFCSLPVFCYCSSVPHFHSLLSALFNLFCLIIQYSITHLFNIFFCPDFGIVFQVFWSPLLSTNNHLTVNKHHTSDKAIFCLIIGSESLIPS